MTRCVVAGLLSLILFADAATGQAARRTYANPIDIDYRYNFEQHNEGISYRSGADPVITGNLLFICRTITLWQNVAMSCNR